MSKKKPRKPALPSHLPRFVAYDVDERGSALIYATTLRGAIAELAKARAEPASVTRATLDSGDVDVLPIVDVLGTPPKRVVTVVTLTEFELSGADAFVYVYDGALDDGDALDLACADFNIEQRIQFVEENGTDRTPLTANERARRDALAKLPFSTRVERGVQAEYEALLGREAEEPPTISASDAHLTFFVNVVSMEVR